MYAFKEVIMSYFKLAYADPRPYMIDDQIEPITCSKGFGNPSGHSLASAMFSVFIFLDLMHGYTRGKNPHIFKIGALYYVFMAFLIWQAAAIPFTRFLMGVHSLDQIVYGSCIGVWAGLTMHLLVRDNMIDYFEDIIDFQKKKQLNSSQDSVPH